MNGSRLQLTNHAKTVLHILVAEADNTEHTEHLRCRIGELAETLEQLMELLCKQEKGGQ